MAGIGEEELHAGIQLSKESNGPHFLAKFILRGSAVLQAVYGHLRSPSSHDVVFGKVFFSLPDLDEFFDIGIDFIIDLV